MRNEFTIVFIYSGPDILDFEGIFNKVPGTLYINPSREEFNQIITDHPDRPLIICGHGDGTGVYNRDMTDYVLSKLNVHLVKKLPYVVGIWCYAGNFADYYKIPGFFTSMWISNLQEAIELGFSTTPNEIKEQNIMFADTMNRLICHFNIDKWIDILKRNVKVYSPKFVKYNYEALLYNPPV